MVSVVKATIHVPILESAQFINRLTLITGTP